LGALQQSQRVVEQDLAQLGLATVEPSGQAEARGEHLGRILDLGGHLVQELAIDIHHGLHGRVEQRLLGLEVVVEGPHLRPTEEQRLRLIEHGTRVVEVDPASELGTWLSEGRSVAALVRPDHTVMQAGQDLAALVLAAPRFMPVGDSGPSGHRAGA